MKVLIVVDMQNDFISGVLGTKEAESIVNNVWCKISEAHKLSEYKVVFTRDTHHEHNYLETEEGKYIPKHCIFGTDGWRLHTDIEKLRDTDEDLVFNKELFGSFEMVEDFSDFYCDPYKDIIESVEIIGLCTDICVINNALLCKSLPIFERVPIYVDASCCAGSTPQNHEKALDVMESCLVHVVNRGSEPWK